MTTQNKNLSRFLRTVSFVVAVFGVSSYETAQAVPSYARQTGQSCVACHAGGQFPELTPYGRMFKLTGYTMGQQTIPLSMMMQADYAKMSNNNLADGAPITKDNVVTLNQISVFLAGKVTNNVGLFSQFTYGPYAGSDGNGGFKGLVNSDLFDLRYANTDLASNNDFVWGLTMHNTVGVQDVWNSSAGPWSYPYVSRAFTLPDVDGTYLEGQGSRLAGIGLYAYLNKHVYLEISGYQTAKNAFSVMAMGYHRDNVYGNNVLQHLSGTAPYVRLAFTKDWGAHSVMLGASYLDAKVYPLNADGTGTAFDTGTTHYKDSSIDGQYQYLLSPHTVTAQFRYVHEASTDVNNASQVSLDTYRAKLAYIYQAKYGISFAYASSSLADGSSDKTKITPEIFFMPVQNIRVGLQYNHFTKYTGSSTFTGNSASNNDYGYLYLWLSY